jgi:hypothetical protein
MLECFQNINAHKNIVFRSQLIQTRMHDTIFDFKTFSSLINNYYKKYYNHFILKIIFHLN